MCVSFKGEYIIQTVDSGNNNELDNLLLEEALQLVDLAADELNVSELLMIC